MPLELARSGARAAVPRPVAPAIQHVLFQQTLPFHVIEMRIWYYNRRYKINLGVQLEFSMDTTDIIHYG